MKAKFILGCILAATGLSLASCGDEFLKEDPKGQLTPGSYFTSQNKLDMAVNALLEQVNHTQNYTNPMYPQWMGDDITANPGSNKQSCAEIDKFSISDNNKGMEAWKKHFTVIEAANNIIENAPGTPVSEEELNIAIGQAKYWRAYAYFHLVRVFGPVPLILRNEADDNKTPLSSVADIYAQVVKDLEDCDAMNLPTSYSTDPRAINGCDVYVSQQVVKATLAAVYMSMAGYPLNLGQDYYTKATAKAKEVIDGANSGKYNLVMDTDWGNVYSYGNNYNHETLLGVNFSPTKNWWTDSQLCNCCFFESINGAGGAGWGDAWGEIKFWKEMPEGPRKHYIYDPQIRLTDGRLVDWWAKKTDGTWEVPEHHPMFSIFTLNANADGKEVKAPYDYTKQKYGGMCTDTRHQLIRYPEVMLWYAEAAARSGQSDLALAKKCLKDVRARAVTRSQATSVDGVSIDAMSAQQLADAAWKEHGWEVAGYWCAMVTRRADELRMNKLKDNFEYRKANTPIEVAPGVKVTESVAVTGTWNDQMIYLPYPGTEVEKNGNLHRTDVLH